jgi:hypothetical protein
MRLRIMMAGVGFVLALSLAPAHATFEIPCGKVGGCVDPPPPPPDDCLNCGWTAPQPSALSQAIAAYRERVGWLNGYIDVRSYLNGPDPASESDLSWRLDDMYARGHHVLLVITRDRVFNEGRWNDVRSVVANLRSGIASETQAIVDLRRTNGELQTVVSAAERSFYILEAQAQLFQEKALALRNDTRFDRALISYLEVFGRDPKFMKAWRDHQTNYTKLYGYWTGTRTTSSSQPLAAASFVAAAALPSLPPLGQAQTLRPEASVDAKLKEIYTLAVDLQREATNRNYFHNETQRLSSERASLSPQFQSLLAAKDSLVRAGVALKDRLAFTDKYTPIETQNRKIAAEALMRETLISFAKEKLLDKAKEAVDNLVRVSGITSAIPTDAEDAIMRAARAGRRILIPQDGFKTQWDAFLKVQRQTATLVPRSQGHILEAARLMGEGSPGELQRHIGTIFGSVRGEAADYVRTVGYSDLSEEQAGPMKKALDWFLDSRKVEEASSE